MEPIGGITQSIKTIKQTYQLNQLHFNFSSIIWEGQQLSTYSNKLKVLV